MSRFEDVLKRAERGLEVPEPERSRILLEMAQDLEDLYGFYRERGVAEEAAAERAEAMLGASPAAKDELARVHAPLHVRVLDRLASGDRHRAERALLSVVTIAAVAGGAGALAASGSVPEASPFVWSLLLIAAVAVWSTGAGVLDRFGASRAAAARRRARLGRLLGLGVLSAAVGALGVVFELWRLSVAVEAAGAADTAVMLPYVARAADLATMSLTVALAVVLAWFHLYRRTVTMERAAVDVERITGLRRGPG